jgi:hypothetical protein
MLFDDSKRSQESKTSDRPGSGSVDSRRKIGAAGARSSFMHPPCMHAPEKSLTTGWDFSFGSPSATLQEKEILFRARDGPQTADKEYASVNLWPDF